jgi:hypothetical protein
MACLLMLWDKKNENTVGGASGSFALLVIRQRQMSKKILQLSCCVAGKSRHAHLSPEKRFHEQITVNKRIIFAIS